METLTQLISELVDRKSAVFTEVSDRIWEFAETRFEEAQSAELLEQTLRSEGFEVERGVAGLDTGFIASFGSGAPVIAILGEYDALAGLSQQAGSADYSPITQGGSGHGCGHNLLGGGALTAAVAVKDYMRRHGIAGTVRYYGCPAEESGYGKTYMAREGLFRDVDAAFSWHPGPVNAVMHGSSNAVIHATFHFRGRSSHAAASPHLGRSALDAVELMNVGVNYMREHMISEARVHYAITNSGGLAPNVVQPEAEVTYLIRAPRTSQVRELYARVQDIARGAALMTQTQMTSRLEGACANLIPNAALERVMHKYMTELGAPAATEEEVRFAKAIYDSTSAEDKASAAAQIGKQLAAELSERPIAEFIAPYVEKLSTMAASTDVADVSWNVPTAQCTTATWAFGTPFHTWQAVAQGQSSYAHKAMLLAGKVMACAAIEALQSAELRAQAKTELLERLDGESYDCLVPSDCRPPRLAELTETAARLFA
ncbi:M20 family metallopeptidase [Paenibacillus doosanensis]|uniref:M20 family metallopeptidase n=1 Tax=Paenibacillus doosanensis TaxID=1229154 RepID=UPI00217FF332|nr:M20 family metallopeptidase [Paenibacillus doosanensis]MCS7463131.1 M20 family metallopeptidase [Paenibacillus doosanensis]